MKRRSFLRLMGVAPAAVPIAAQDVAAKMGIGIASAGMPSTAIGGYAGQCDAAVPTSDPTHYLREAISNYVSDESRKRRRFQARERIRHLDMDLASMRSISPAFALTRQIDREVKGVEESEGGWLKREAKRLGIPWLS